MGQCENQRGDGQRRGEERDTQRGNGHNTNNNKQQTRREDLNGEGYSKGIIEF